MPENIDDLREVLDTVSEKIPALITQLRNTLFSAEAGRELGRAVGAFYKELVDSGVPSDKALEMAQDYIGSLQGLLSQAKVQ